MKERWYYPHEEFFFWLIDLVVFLVAIALGSANFVAMLFAGFPFWAAIYLGWWLLARNNA